MRDPDHQQLIEAFRLRRSSRRRIARALPVAEIEWDRIPDKRAAAADIPAAADILAAVAPLATTHILAAADSLAAVDIPAGAPDILAAVDIPAGAADTPAVGDNRRAGTPARHNPGAADSRPPVEDILPARLLAPSRPTCSLCL
jgi:hypothetical protein